MNFKDLNNYNLNGSPMIGVHEGIISGQHDRVEDINFKIYDRHSDYNNQYSPIFEPRPTPTKQSIFPIVNFRNTDDASPSLVSTFDYQRECVNKLPIENTLHSRNFALQKGADQAIYIPASSSDLYNVSVQYAPSFQPFPMLFSESDFQDQSRPHANARPHIGNEIFGNNTRVQLRSV